MKKLITLLLFVALAITTVITVHNACNSEWETTTIVNHDIFDSKNPNWVYDVIVHDGSIQQFISSKQWKDGDIIKVLVRTCVNGELKAIRGKTLTKAEKDALVNEEAKAAYNEILSLAVQHLEFCETTTSLNERYADSQATLEAINNIMLSYPNGFDEFAFYDAIEESELRIAMISAEYLF